MGTRGQRIFARLLDVFQNEVSDFAGLATEHEPFAIGGNCREVFDRFVECELSQARNCPHRRRAQAIAQTAKVLGHFAHRLVSIVGFLGQRSRHDALQFGRSLGVEVAQRRRLDCQDLLKCLRRSLAAKRTPSRDRLVDNAAEREDVGARIRGESGDLLWRDVPDRPHDSATARQGCSRRLTDLRLHEKLRQPEVENLCVAVRRDHDVFRLQVTMDDVRLVCARECVSDLDQQIEKRGDLVVARDAIAQSLAGNVFHRNVVARSGADLVNRQDVRVIQR